MTKRKPSFEQLVDAAKQSTDGPSDFELKTALRNIEQQLDEPSHPPSAWTFRWALAGAGMLAVAVFAALWMMRSPNSHWGHPVTVEFVRGHIEIADASGRPVAQGAPLPANARLTLGEAARVRLKVGKVAEIALLGPSILEGASDQRVAIRHGRAAFSVQKRRARSEFLVQAGDSLIAVRGTRFELDVDEGRLQALRVTEGIVEVTGPQFSKPLQLNAGESLGRPLASLWSEFETPIEESAVRGTVDAGVEASNEISFWPETAQQPITADRNGKETDSKSNRLSNKALFERAHRARCLFHRGASNPLCVKTLLFGRNQPGPARPKPAGCEVFLQCLDLPLLFQLRRTCRRPLHPVGKWEHLQSDGFLSAGRQAFFGGGNSQVLRGGHWVIGHWVIDQ